MYNRYIPQSDGTHRRRPTPEPAHSPPPQEQPRQEQHAAPQHTQEAPSPAFGGIGAFLRQILPKDFDIGDLIVVLLLLLIAADKKDEENSALLTLALYLFL